MSGAAAGANVRLVRCPKCRGILQEVADVPVYKCGGCYTILRAKHRKEAGQSSSSGTLDDIPTQENASESKELSSSSQELNLAHTEASEQVQFECCDKEEQSGSRDVSKGISLPNELISCQEKKQHTEADANNEVDYEFSSSDSQLVSERYDTNCVSLRSSDESTVPSHADNPSSNEQLDQSHEIILHDSDDTRSRVTVETTEVTDDNNIPEEEEEDKYSGGEVTDANDISGRLICIPTSPTTRSNHAYDGSVSSYEGWDDQIADQDIHLFKKGLFEPRKLSGNFNSKGRPTTMDIPVNYKMDTNIDLPLRSRKFSSLSLNVKKGPVILDKNVNRDQDRLPDVTSNDIGEQVQHNNEGIHPVRNGMRSDDIGEQVQHNNEGIHPVRNGMRSERDEVLYRKPFYRKESSADDKNGGPSSYRNKEFMYGQGLHSSDNIPYVNRSRMELLRKVDEFRDQLCRSYAQRGKTNGEFPIRGTQQDNEQAMYHNHEASEQEFLRCYDGNHPCHLSGAYRPSKSVPFQHGTSRVPFSGKATNCRHHADYTCLHGCCKQWQCSLQMPPPNVCCNNHPCGINPGHICYHPCDSGPANPHRHMDPKFPSRACNSEPLPHDQRYMERKVEKLYHRDRRNPIKRHCLPIVGGAPLVICRRCRKMLQLPADFSPSSKRCNKLRCGSCSEVLIFQFYSRTNVPYHQPNPAVPPPSEAGSSSTDATTTMKILASKYHANDFSQGDEELNCEDHRVAVLTRSQGRHESSAGPFSEEAKVKKSLRGKEVCGSKGSSALHRLMGYASPSLVIKRSSKGIER